MPRAKGTKNYKNDLLIPIVAEILPNGEFGQAREGDPCNTDDLKRHWVKNLCQNMKKPMGRPGKNSDRRHRCIAIECKIMEKKRMQELWGLRRAKMRIMIVMQ